MDLMWFYCSVFISTGLLTLPLFPLLVSLGDQNTFCSALYVCGLLFVSFSTCGL